MLKAHEQSRAKQVFFLALGLSLLVFLPFVIYDKGYFFFLGDFNVQQVPFYSLAHDAIRKGEVFWNWNTDLGVNFLGSYSFYLLFSPFFWITLLFPSGAVPYMMAPLLALKTACAALTAYWYIERFLRDKGFAVIGSLLYAFSGFSIYNIFFNHFHEAIVFFPLLLIAVEELVVNNRRGLFVMAVAINAIVNYWFFIGEVVFVILYVFIRMTSQQWRMTVGKFISIAWESVLGVMLAMMVLLPSVMAIMGNPRTTADNILSGWNFWIYWSDQRLPAILQSLFFPPDLPSQPNFFPEHNAKWSSMTAWLPMVSMSGVIAYLFSARNNWLKKILLISLLIALIPGFNSLFVLFNHSYYARWFYMPILLMALATAIAFERRKTVDLHRGIRWTAAIMLLFTIAIGLTPIQEDGKYTIGLSGYPLRFWAYVAFSALGILLTLYILKQFPRTGMFKRFLLTGIAGCAVVFSWAYLTMGKCYSDDTAWIRDIAIGGRGKLQTHQNTGEFFRTDIYKSMDNLGMYWQIPNIQAFHSVVSPAIMEFYPEVDVKRDVSSKPEVEHYALRSLLSVKYHYVPASKDSEDSEIFGFESVFSEMGFNIYENKNYLPMGFGYGRISTREVLNSIPKDLRVNYMMNTLILEEDEAVNRYQHLLEYTTDVDYSQMSERKFEENVAERRLQSAESFVIDPKGFTAKSNLDAPTLLFFSVPYDKGWSATVNGMPVQIEKANIGFMALEVPAGEAEIRFTFFPVGLTVGFYVTLAGIFLFVAYLFLCKKKTVQSHNILEEGNMPSMLSDFEGLKHAEVKQEADPQSQLPPILQEKEEIQPPNPSAQE